MQDHALHSITRSQDIISSGFQHSTILVATVLPIMRDGIDLGDLITLAQRQLVLLSGVIATRPK